MRLMVRVYVVVGCLQFCIQNRLAKSDVLDQFRILALGAPVGDDILRILELSIVKFKEEGNKLLYNKSYYLLQN